ncbi:MAG TPA: UbiD family decarboxylase [Actinoplanes sp.]|nr:UbiD family decarboxylase [Actinoplanes sp.]
MSVLTGADAAALGLPDHYDAAALFRCREPVASSVELMRRLADLERERGYRPTVVFEHLVDRPGRRVLANPYPRPVILASLGLHPGTWLETMTQRLEGGSPGVEHTTAPAPWHEVGGLDDLPVVQHRPGDAGRYVTAGVAVSADPDGRSVNLGVYRIQVVGNRHARIFMDPRTDGYRNAQAWAEQGQGMPLTVFLGADPALMMVAASRLPAEGDDYTVAARLLGSHLRVTEDRLPVPLSATHVINGRVTDRLEPEGPFGEFKGHYVDARLSPAFEIDNVMVRASEAPFPTILPGAESGLTLMSMQNEYLMYAHLRSAGINVTAVRYPLHARAEFLAFVECTDPTREVLAMAMKFDVRAKVIVCGRDLGRPGLTLASNGFTTISEPYVRKGLVEGERIGMLLNISQGGRPVEY